MKKLSEMTEIEIYDFLNLFFIYQIPLLNVAHQI
jgi:hypothetical protein